MVLDDIRFVPHISDVIVRGDLIVSSDYVRVRCRCYRGVGYGFPCMGIHPRPLDLYVLPHLLRSVLQHSLCILAFIYTVPIGVIQAITNQQVGLNVITELIIGYALPGRPIAMMMFKTWGYITMTQALQFTSDFKLAHYMKIAHRPMFFCQVAATVVAGTVQLGVQAWMFSNIEGLCSPDQKDGFICPATTVFGTASIIVSLSCYYIFLDFGCSIPVVCVVVGCHWTTAPVLARSTLLRPRLLFPGRRSCAIVAVDFTQEAQDQFPQIYQLPPHLH